MLERSISLFCTGGSVFPTQLPPWCAIMKMNLTEICYCSLAEKGCIIVQIAAIAILLNIKESENE